MLNVLFQDLAAALGAALLSFALSLANFVDSLANNHFHVPLLLYISDFRFLLLFL